MEMLEQRPAPGFIFIERFLLAIAMIFPLNFIALLSLSCLAPGALAVSNSDIIAHTGTPVGQVEVHNGSRLAAASSNQY